jgi:hypothetical protein
LLIQFYVELEPLPRMLQTLPLSSSLTFRA